MNITGKFWVGLTAWSTALVASEWLGLTGWPLWAMNVLLFGPVVAVGLIGLFYLAIGAPVEIVDEKGKTVWKGNDDE